MDAIAKPLYIVLPILEEIFPRREVIHDINSVRALFDSIIAEKCADRERGTNGMLSIMIDDDTLTDDEIRDNLIVFFMAGHVSRIFIVIVCFLTP
jgi:cytochrome P450